VIHQRQDKGDTMHRSLLGGIIIDCETADLAQAGEFWSRALGLPIARATTSADPRYVTLQTRPGEPYVELQAVDHPSRVHLDLKTDAVDAEVARLERLGARPVRRIGHWCVMEAPTGHRFCVVALHPGENVGVLNVWDDA
jgi:catechol 2,3-dioxygenase-like lactoylglutathione lyase family enzyme